MRVLHCFTCNTKTEQDRTEDGAKCRTCGWENCYRPIILPSIGPIPLHYYDAEFDPRV